MRCITSLIFMSTLAVAALAGVPTQTSYQGMLFDDTGVPLDGPHDLTFTIYPDSLLSDVVIWTEVHSGVEVTDGLFHVMLGCVDPLDAGIFNTAPQWIGVTVGSGPEMAPRVRLTSVPYAARAAVAEVALGGELTLPYSGTVVNGSPAFSITNTGSGVAIMGRCDSDDDNGTAAGSFSNTRPEGTGCLGLASGTGVTRGGWFSTFSPDGIGVHGASQVGGGTGVLGSAGYLGYGVYSAGRFHCTDTITGESTLAIGTDNHRGVMTAVSQYPNFRLLGNNQTAGNTTMIILGHTGDLLYEKVAIISEAVGDHNRGKLHFAVNEDADASLVGLDHARLSILGNGNVGIGVPAPQARLDLGGTPGVDGIRFPDGTLQTTATPAGGLTLPYSGSVSTSGDAFLVDNTHSTGTGIQGNGGEYGVYGRCENYSGTGYGVHGWTDSDLGAGVWGACVNDYHGGYGGYFTSDMGAGIYCRLFGTSGYVGDFYNAYDDGHGIFVQADNAIWGYASSSNTEDYGVGALGECSGNGRSEGVRGEATGNGYLNVGVYGAASGGTSNYAGYFNGTTRVLGTLIKSAGSFQIDHPLDPENKYLNHSFVESPDMMNVYNGNVVLDGQGEAWVEMPGWFEALNSEFRYQLTAIGGPGPDLYIAEKMSGNRFRIAGGSPGLEVSWQVTGIRHDPYAEEHRIPVEQVKGPHERGKYLHPELHGRGEESGVDDNTRQRERRREDLRQTQERRDRLDGVAAQNGR